MVEFFSRIDGAVKITATTKPEATIELVTNLTTDDFMEAVPQRIIELLRQFYLNNLATVVMHRIVCAD